MSSVPPDATTAVFAATGKATIDAPIEKVWEVLLDFPSYPEWNSFVRSQQVVDTNNKPVAEQQAKEGAFMYLSVHIPPSMEPQRFPSTTSLLVTLVDAENYRVAWKNRMPQWLLRTERWQWLTVVDGKTKYETIEVFNGPAAYLVRWFVGSGLKKSFQAMADDLKTRTESLHGAAA